MIGDNLVVSMHYTLTNDSGEILDSSVGSEPLVYLQGAGNIIPGLEKALVGKMEGSKAQVKVDPSEGYGDIDANLVQDLDRSVFQGVDTIEVGMEFEAKAPNGQAQRIVVSKVEGEKITIDANHPLAGVVLNFDVEIVGVREATAEEVSHGHVH